MKQRYIAIVLLLTIGHLLTELHTVIMWLNPATIDMNVNDWFIKKGFKSDDINVLWYSKMIEDSFLFVALVFSGACQAFSKNYQSYLLWQRYSIRLYVIWCIYLGYHLFDMGSFLYNFKTSYTAYIVALLLCTVASLFVGFFKVKRFVEN